jgi:hypothetical protein
LQRPGAEFDRVARGALVHRGNRRLPVELSRDSLFGQRIDLSLSVQGGYGGVDGAIIFPVARQRNVKFVIGTALNAGFISGSPRYNYGKTSWNIPHQYIEKRERLRAVAA